MLIIIVSLFALFFSAAGYLRVKHPDTFDKIQNTIVKPITTEDLEATDTGNRPELNSSVSITPVDENGNSVLAPATYEDYSPEKIARASTAPVVLFFHASWCPSCISTDRILKKKIVSLPPGVSILKIDYDTATDLKIKYNITYQHTFVQVDTNGIELTRWSGGALDGINANLMQ